MHVNDATITLGCYRYIVSQRGIEANPEKVSVVAKMGPIWDIKGVQNVIGCLAALSRTTPQPLISDWLEVAARGVQQ